MREKIYLWRYKNLLKRYESARRAGDVRATARLEGAVTSWGYKWWFSRDRKDLALDITGTDATKQELNNASNLKGDYARLHPDDKKWHDKVVRVTQDRSSKITFLKVDWPSAKSGVLTVICRDGVPQIPTFLDDDERAELQRKLDTLV